MAQVISSNVIVVPKEGAIEVNLNINITLDGKMIATSDNATVIQKKEEKKEETSHIIPDFSSGFKLSSFGK